MAYKITGLSYNKFSSIQEDMTAISLDAALHDGLQGGSYNSCKSYVMSLLLSIYIVTIKHEQP